MSNQTAVTQTTNIVPVQGIFQPEPTYDIITFIGPAGTPFYAPVNPLLDGVTITNSTINSSVIGGLVPVAAFFTNVSTTTGQVATLPSASTDIANKQYVDSVAQGLDIKAACLYTTTGNITLSGLTTQAGGDWGSTLTAGSRVLVKNQAAPAENGIYAASATGWTRTADMNVWAEVPSAFTFIQQGVTLADTGWVCTADPGGTIDVTAMPWTQFSGAGTYLAGNGLQIVGNTFSVKPNGTSLDASSSGLKISDTYAGQTSITTLGTIATGTWAGTAIAANHGGTGQTSYTTGDLLYASDATTLSKLNDIATGNALISGGVGVAPSWGKIGLTTHVTGTLPIANGGTNATTTPTAGAVAYGTGTAYGFTAAGTAGQVLVSNGTSAPSWSSIGTGDVSGPASATDNAIARFDGTTGKLIQNSGVTIDDTANIASVASLNFNTAAGAAYAYGRLYWSSTGTLNVGLDGGASLVMPVGEVVYTYGKASSAISIGQVIIKTGVVGASGVIEFGPSTAGITDGNTIVGIACEPIASGSFGRVVVQGVVRGFNLSAYNNNDTLWYDPAGGGALTATKPSAPNLKAEVGIVINAGSGGSGSMYVSLFPGSQLGGTDQNVQITGTPSNGSLLQYDSALQYWKNVASSTVSVGTASNLAGGGAGYIPYQSGAGATSFLGVGTTGQVLTSNGSSAPTWTTPTAYATVTDDTTTNSTRYPLFANQTTGNLTTNYVSSTKYQFNPSTGELSATGFTGSGANLTNLPAGQLSGTIPSTVLGNSTVYIGTTGIALNRSSASQSLTGVNIDGSAGSATTAGTATNATNVAVTDNTSTNSDYYPTYVTNTTGNLPITVSSTKLKYNPSTGVLTATGGVAGGNF